MTPDDERLNVWKDLREKCMAAFVDRQAEVTITLRPLAMMDLIDEVLDRHPRNMSRLFRDDTVDRLHAVIDRLHEELNFLIALGPSPTVTERYSPVRPQHKRKVAVSDELRDSIKRKK